MKNSRFQWITFLMMISFASANAVIPSPALPEISQFFQVSHDWVQSLMSLYLVGYALGQLVYGPIANRYGRKTALYVGIIIQILTNAICILAGMMHWFLLLPVARFIMALGAGVGLKMSFTLINETGDQMQAAQRTSILIIAFAIAPGLSIVISSVFFHLLSWQGCFYFAISYGLILLALVSRLAETLQKPDLNAFKLSVLARNYRLQFSARHILQGGMLMGCVSTFVYLFATFTPMIVIYQHGETEIYFALLNMIPSLGMLLGAIVSAHITRLCGSKVAIEIGITLASLAVLTMAYAYAIKLSLLMTLFIPMALINFSLSLVLANVSAQTLQRCEDKSNGSAVLNFINMGMTALLVLTLSLLPISPLLLIQSFSAIAVMMIIVFKATMTNDRKLISGLSQDR